jgi:hypothetical protein
MITIDPSNPKFKGTESLRFLLFLEESIGSGSSRNHQKRGGKAESKRGGGRSYCTMSLFNVRSLVSFKQFERFKNIEFWCFDPSLSVILNQSNRLNDNIYKIYKISMLHSPSIRPGAKSAVAG